jgi:hypothetical protein
MRSGLLLGVPVAAGVVGATLSVAGVHAPVTGALTLVFVLLTPAVCVAALLRGLDPLARAIVAGTASVALAGAVAETMLVTSGWSPTGGIVATAIVCAALAAAVLLPRRRSRPAAPDRPRPGGTVEDTIPNL